MPDAVTTATTETATTAATTATTAATTSATSAVVEPFYKDWLQSDGSLNAKSYDRLPDHLKGLRPTLERQKNIEGVLLALDHSQTLAGKKALAPLDANAPEQVRAERKSLLDTINGVPPAAKDYGITRPQEIPEAQWNQPLADGFAAWAHKNSVSPGAVKELADLHNGTVKQQLEAQKQGEEAFWGNEQKTFEALIKRDNIPADRAAALVEKGVQAFGMDLANPQTALFLKGAQARLMAMKHALAIGEDNAHAPSEGNAGAGDPGAQASDIQHNPANPLYAQYWNKEGKFSRTVQSAAVEKVNALLAQAAAKKPAQAGRGRR